MDTFQLEMYMKTDPEISRCYGGVVAKDLLPEYPRKPSFYIVNQDTSEKAGSHWIAVNMVDDELTEYFDPLGKEPDNYLKDYMSSQSKSYQYNTKRCQNYISNICGQYCLFYCYFRAREYSMQDILDMFEKNDLRYNDQLIYFFYKYTTVSKM